MDAVAASIREFGFKVPIITDKDGVIIAGHTRLKAAEKLGLETVPVIVASDLTEEQAKALRLADNKTAELAEWNADLLLAELANIDIDMGQFAFDTNDFLHDDWFRDRERNDTSRQEGNEEYNEFLDKFEQPKTTDDCYTPDNIYDAVADYVCEKFGKKRETFVRPFYPGGDYQAENYSPGSVVVDNPPFSILAEIVDFYVDHSQPFFLFAPGLATLNYTNRQGVTAMCTYVNVTYENGANVTTSFLTNLTDPDIAAIADPDLYQTIAKLNEENEKAMKRHFPKYDYPYEVLTAAKMGWLCKYGQRMEIRRTSSMLIRALDMQKEEGKGIYGCGLLLSTRAAAERAAAERAAAICYQLSERERAIIASLDEIEASHDEARMA